MQMAEDYAQYWDLTESDSFGTEVYFSRVNDGTENDHLPTAHNQSSGSMCISNLTTFRWSQIIKHGKKCNNKTIKERSDLYGRF